MSDEKDKKEAQDEKELTADEESSPEVATAPATDVPPTPEAAAPVPPVAAPVATPEAQAPVQAAEPAAAPAAAPEPAAPVESAAAPEHPAPPPAPVEDPVSEAAKKDMENEVFIRDLSSGKIHPETYQSLFHKQDTLGKLGTLFGLLVSGAGAGLTHQPNAVMAMMDQQIKNDLERQKEDQQNAQNWYSKRLEFERNQPENARVWAEAALAGHKAERQQLENAQAGVEDMSVTNDLMNAKRAAAIQSNQDRINRMAPGPDRDAQQQMQDKVAFPFFLSKMKQGNAETTQKVALVKAATQRPSDASNKPPKGAAEPGKTYDTYDTGKYGRMLQMGKINPAARDKSGNPTAIDPRDAPEVDAEIKKLTNNRNLYADVVDTFHKLAKLKRGGQTPVSSLIHAAGTGIGGAAGMTGGPLGAAAGAIGGGSVAESMGEGVQNYFERERSSLLEPLKGRLARGGASEAEVNKIINGLMPGVADNEKDLPKLFDQVKRHFEHSEAEITPKMDFYKVKYPAPNYQFMPQKKEVGKEGKSMRVDVKAPTAASARGQE